MHQERRRQTTTAILLALAMLLGAPRGAVAMAPAPHAAMSDNRGDGGDDGDDGGDVRSEEGSDVSNSNGVQLFKHSSSRDKRMMVFDVLGTAVVGGIVLNQFQSRRPAAQPVFTRLSPRGDGMELADISDAAGDDEDEAAIDEPGTIVTPEPGTLALLGAGLGAVAFAGRKRFARRAALES